MKTQNSLQARHYLVTGRVQGVGFRAATAAQARQLGVCGWVRNLADGRVEVLAWGDQLDQFEAWLRHGPALARVDDLVSEPAPGESGQDFRLLPTA